MKPEDFAHMDWRIDLCPDRNALEEYEELNARFKKFSLDSVKVFKEISNDQLVRAIVYSYHKHSPFVRKITEPKHRKSQALVQAGVDLKLQETKEIIECTNERVSDMIFHFLMGENNFKFSALMMQIDAYYKENYKLAYGEVANTKNAMAVITDLQQSIDNLSAEVFHGERELANFAMGAMNRGLILSPEQNAHKK